MANNVGRRPLSIQAALDKSKLSSDETYQLLVRVDVRNRFTNVIEATYRLASAPNNVADDAPIDETAGGITFRGQVYVPASFDINVSERAGEIPEITMSFDDISGTVRNAIEQYQGGVGSDVTMFIVSSAHVTANSTGASALKQKAEIEETFNVIGSTVSDRKLSFQLGAPNLLATNFPRRRQTADYCQWAFKSAECGYVGADATCARTLNGTNGCVLKGNALNFGGFPGLVSRGAVR